MEINSRKLDDLYKEWSGEHHTTNSNKPTHDSSECTDFAEYCLKYGMSDGKKCKLNAPSNWIIFVVVQRILGFPFFLALATFGVIILLIKYMANYVKYGGEAISYTEKTRRKMIDDVFHKLVEQQK